MVPKPAVLPCAACTLCGLGNLKYEMSLIDDKSSEFKSFFFPQVFSFTITAVTFKIKLSSLCKSFF